MAASSLFDAPIDNHGLFADHYPKMRRPPWDLETAFRSFLDNAEAA